ncbi:hypothetical protein pipiens_002898 [Culex pipiens pipiens]|uniref:Uncharacterized protein n=1 Tax=Culex pipiens pipiens TaxID=38569 RepID=A0ABD1D700_CULPP
MALSRLARFCVQRQMALGGYALRVASGTSGTFEEQRFRFRIQTVRQISSSLAAGEKLATAKAVQKHDWNRAVSEAEKIVGYPTSFLSLRWLLSDEIANVALHLRKLVGSNHPLLKTANQQVANLRNQDLNLLISSAYRDLAESNFIGDRDEQNNPLPSKPSTAVSTSSPDCRLDELDFGDLEDNTQSMDVERALGHPEKEWSLRHVLGGGSLLGKSCQGALMLAGRSEEMQKQGYLFGRHLSLAWQACIDLQPFLLSNLPQGSQFSLVSAPVLFHLEYDPSIYSEIEKGRNSIEEIDYSSLHKAIGTGPGLERTKNLMKKHSHAAMAVLDRLEPSDARTALQNIILAMQEL